VEAQTTDQRILEVESWVEQNIPLYVERGRMPGLSIAVVKDGKTIAESVFAILMGKDPAGAIPGLYIRERMKRLMGDYEVYRGLEQLKVVNRGGLLYLEEKSRGTEKTTLTPLIPEDPTLASRDFFVLRNGLKSPVEFAVREDGTIDLFIGRYCYHKVD